MLSAGMFSALAAAMAVRSRGLPSGSPPLLAAMVISLIRRVKILPRFASSAPFLCLIVAHFEWPDIVRPRQRYEEFATEQSLTAHRRRAPKNANRLVTNGDYSMGACNYLPQHATPSLPYSRELNRAFDSTRAF